MCIYFHNFRGSKDFKYMNSFIFPFKYTARSFTILLVLIAYDHSLVSLVNFNHKYLNFFIVQACVVNLSAKHPGNTYATDMSMYPSHLLLHSLATFMISTPASLSNAYGRPVIKDYSHISPVPPVVLSANTN